MRKAAAKLARWFHKRWIRQSPPAIRSPLRPRASAGHIGAFCHIFYPELANEILAHLAHVPGEVDLLISTDNADKARLIATALSGWSRGKTEIAVLPNRGRDISPRMTFYRHQHDRYDLVLYLHTKRGKFLIDGDEWRRYLFRTLVGSPAIVRENLARFTSDANLGILFARHWPPIAPFIGWGGNVRSATALATRIGLPGIRDTVEFPSGSMFWARPAALRPLLGLGLTIEDFEPELGQLDGTQAHAIERMFLIACEAAGYGWTTIEEPNSGRR